MLLSPLVSGEGRGGSGTREERKLTSKEENVECQEEKLIQFSSPCQEEILMLLVLCANSNYFPLAGPATSLTETPPGPGVYVRADL